MPFSQCVGFEWDDGNIPKVAARVPLDAVELAFSGNPLIAEDREHAAHEPRWFLVNRVHERWLFVVFTTRHARIRVVSARYMHRQEVAYYETYLAEKEKNR